MIAACLFATWLLQTQNDAKWQKPEPPPRKEWPLFQSHPPVAPPNMGPGFSTWVYSFRGGFDEVVRKTRLEISNRYHDYGATYVTADIKKHLYDRNLSIGQGSITISILVYDDSYTFLENCRVGESKTFEDITRNAKKDKGWITVIRNQGEKDPNNFCGDLPKLHGRANSWSDEVPIPIPPLDDWPLYFGKRPFAVEDASVGDIRFWLYVFQANWDEIAQLSKTEFGKRGYEMERYTPADGSESIRFQRGMYEVIGILLQDDSYGVYKDCRLAITGTRFKTIDYNPAPGWITVVRIEPVSGPNLRFARERDGE